MTRTSKTFRTTFFAVSRSPITFENGRVLDYEEERELVKFYSKYKAFRPYNLQTRVWATLARTFDTKELFL